ncbi:MAG: hypothetical protein H0V05_13755 [Euzebyaceae bacterium]|nr:hypothetical protein [Euzebyaceae bacterium]
MTAAALSTVVGKASTAAAGRSKTTRHDPPRLMSGIAAPAWQREAFRGLGHTILVAPENVLGVLSPIFWSLPVAAATAAASRGPSPRGRAHRRGT